MVLIASRVRCEGSGERCWGEVPGNYDMHITASNKSTINHPLDHAASLAFPLYFSLLHPSLFFPLAFKINLWLKSIQKWVQKFVEFRSLRLVHFLSHLDDTTAKTLFNIYIAECPAEWMVGRMDGAAWGEHWDSSRWWNGLSVYRSNFSFQYYLLSVLVGSKVMDENNGLGYLILDLWPYL